MTNKTNGRSLREKQQNWRNQISKSLRETNALKRIVDHVAGKNEMKATQIRAAEMLLKKVLPDLSATELSQDGTFDLPTVINIIAKQEKDNK